MKNKSAFTLVELLVVIAIIGIISTLAVVSLTNARQSARDAKRLADIKQIQTALELYYQDNGEYPSSITDSIATSGNIYMQSSPIAPTPADGDCSDTDNVYTYTVSGTENSSYSLTFCLGSQINDLSAGIKEAIPGGITSLTSEGSESGIWQLVGAAGFSNIGTGIFSTNSADDVRLSFYNGTPYVAFIDNSYGYEESCGEYTCYYNGKITVMKYNGSVWENVGNPGFSSTEANSLSFFIYGETPYIAYSDSSNFYKTTVMKFDGTDWVNVGSPGFSTEAGSTSIYVHNGIPYVAYSDAANNGKVTVMKYN
jgi:prepilin-type N-terminal cleavage/methylation domain-containing protein